MHREIGNRIKGLRGAVSQERFAGQLGISKQGYLRYEYGKRIPPGEVLQKIAEIGGVTVDWILTGADRVGEERAAYLDDETRRIVDMLKDMDRAGRQDVLKYAEKEKLLADLKRGRLKKEVG